MDHMAIGMLNFCLAVANLASWNDTIVTMITLAPAADGHFTRRRSWRNLPYRMYIVAQITTPDVQRYPLFPASDLYKSLD